MRDFRLKALAHFLVRQQPTCGSPMLAERNTVLASRGCSHVVSLFLAGDGSKTRKVVIAEKHSAGARIDAP